MDRKKVKLIIGIVAVVFFVISIALFIITFATDIKAPASVFLGIVAVVCLALAIELGYMFLLNRSVKANYFLYDPATKRNVPIQKLSFAVINARTGRYLLNYAPSEGKIWNDRVLDEAEVDDEFKPLIAYKLLFNIAETDIDAGWKCLENASNKTIVFICEALNSNSDFEFSNNFAKMMAEKPLNMGLIRDYLIRNKRYMQSRMLKYVTDNIELF